ncbi:MAG TPA: hypothetical protein VN698_10400 [Bacteroidia bacterium]|nr:hypothetical protein [Bacteroidia bacterium]
MAENTNNTNNTQTTLTHWKKLTNPDYLGAYDFQPNEERILTVRNVKLELVMGSSGKKENCTVVYFREKSKPMILNATNAKMLQFLAGTAYIEQWGGVQIKLIVQRVAAFGEMVDALRIKKEKIQQEKQQQAKPILILGSNNFQACKNAYIQNPANLDKILIKYNVSDEVLAAIKNIETNTNEANNEAV